LAAEANSNRVLRMLWYRFGFWIVVAGVLTIINMVLKTLGVW
jgi:hypothetical protein